MDAKKLSDDLEVSGNPVSADVAAAQAAIFGLDESSEKEPAEEKAQIEEKTPEEVVVEEKVSEEKVIEEMKEGLEDKPEQMEPEAQPASPTPQDTKPEDKSQKHRILILGAGFGGVHAAQSLLAKYGGRKEFEITMVSKSNYFLFTPMLPEVVGGVLSTGSVTVPVRDILSGRNFQFVRGDVASIDMSKKSVKVLSGDVEQDMMYDYLVVSLGAKVNFFDTPGAEENCLTLNTVENAHKIRNRAIDMFEMSYAAASDEERKEELRFVIVGGGPSGIETAGEILHMINNYLSKSYKRDAEVIIVEAADRLVPGSDPMLGDVVRKRLEKIGVKVRLNSKVTKVVRDGIELGGDEFIKSDTIIWAAGVSGSDVQTSPEAMKDGKSRFVVNDKMQMPGYPEVFVMGDCAAVEGNQYPPTARVVLQQAKVVSKNVQALLSNKDLTSFNYRHPGDLMTVGSWYATLYVGNMVFHGSWVWLMWKVVYLSKIIGVRSKARVALDWMFGSIFKKNMSRI
jgi:NADH dehydrogenase